MNGGGVSKIIGAVVVLVALGALLWWLMSRSPISPATESAASDAVEAVREVSAPPAVSVPTTQNPIKQVLPQRNPLETANPFNDAYVNPFE